MLPLRLRPLHPGLPPKLLFAIVPAHLPTSHHLRRSYRPPGATDPGPPPRTGLEGTALGHLARPRSPRHSHTNGPQHRFTRPNASCRLPSPPLQIPPPTVSKHHPNVLLPHHSVQTHHQRSHQPPPHGPRTQRQDETPTSHQHHESHPTPTHLYRNQHTLQQPPPSQSASRTPSNGGHHHTGPPLQSIHGPHHHRPHITTHAASNHPIHLH